MAEVTVKQLAQVVGTPVDKLLVQLRDAGVDKSGESDAISDSEKGALLAHLRKSRGGGDTAATEGARKITLRRKRVSALKTDASGRKTVNVEVRSRRTYLKSGEAAEPVAAPPSAAPAAASPSQAVASPPPSAPQAPAAPEVSASLDESAARAVDDTSHGEAPAADTAEINEAAAAAAEDAVLAEAARAHQTLQDEQVEPTPLSAEQSLELEAAAAAQAADATESPSPAAAAQATTDTDAPAQPAARSAAEVARYAQMEDEARKAAERQAERVFIAERKKSEEDEAKRDRERREALRLAEEAQRRAAMEAQQAASSNDRGTGRKDAKPRGKGRNEPTRYGRNQLHVAKDKSGRRKGKAARRAPAGSFESKHEFQRPTAPVVREVDVPDTITVAELGNRMAVKANEVIRAMMGMGVMATINQMLDQDTAILVVEEMGHIARPVGADDVESSLAEKVVGERDGDAVSRPPVVTVMGHVDHGKTSLLDYIRKARVASGEAGGITQHIGAYQAETDKGVITFLDTPGHAAFTSMRARGAQATDIVVLVVAADDGVMPQTVEAVQHAKAAGVPLVVAVNKMDKEGADPERVRNELAQHDVISEEWGGDTQFLPVSALKGEGIDALLDALVLQAEVLELSAVPEGNATGVVVEASLDKGRGPVATILVQSGQLKRGDTILCGQVTGRVRAMFDENGDTIEVAGPSTPVQVLGLSSAPNAGDEMLVAADEKTAKELAELRQGKQRDQRLADRRPAKLDDVFSNLGSNSTPIVNLVVKADVKGSFEAIRDSLEKLSTDEVDIRVIGGGVGGITESDANLASASDAILVGFNVRADGAARRLIQEQDTDLRYYSVIYELIDLVKATAGGLLKPEVRERIIGNAEVKDVFKSPRFGQIAGCMVVDGVVKREMPIRVLRDNVVIFEGELDSLRRFKDDVKEVHMGTECGIGVKNYTDVRPGDSIEVFERTEVARSL